MLDSERNNHETDDNQARDHAQENGGGASGTAGSGAPAGVPGVLFQAPQVMFQPPAPVAPPAGPPSSGSSSDSGEEPAESGGGRGGRGSRGSRGGSGAKGSDGGSSSKSGDTGKSDDSGKASDSPKTGDGGPAKDQDSDETSTPNGSEDSGSDTGDGDDSGSGRRRRRRNGRGRGRSGDQTESADAEGAVSEAGGESGSASGSSGSSGSSGKDGDDSDDAEESGSSSRRRRRKRRRGGSSDGDVTAPDDPPDTVVHVREQRNPADDVRAIKGSTRLEAKKQRRREGRESGRRRPPVVTESEFLARRESVERQMVVRQRGDRTQIAVLEDDVLVEHYVNRTTHQSYVGNVYLGKVQNVLPSMEAAFVDIGKGRNAVLYAGEVNFDASGLEGQPKRIEAALKPGQSVIVQVTKDPVGHKGARLTSQISLPGRYLVYVPGASMTGISRKLPDTERTRLKQILKKVMPENAGVIVRTAAEGAAEAELDRDVTRLAAQWESIEKKARTASAPALLYGEPDLTVRVVRDVFNEDFSKLIVSGDDGWDTIDEYVRYVAPHLADRVTRWEGDDPESAEATDDVFAAYRIDEQLAKALERKVWLPSGGSLVIDRTEAMTVIDVNTGKFTGQGGNLEETVTRNNLEAAEEIVRQLRLRDIGGIVVIDFIDMVLESNRELILRRLLECLARDRTKHQVAEVTSLGLVQMTRKRVGAGLLEAFSEPCECCNGRGLHLTLEPVEPSHRSSAGHSGGSGGSRRSGRGPGGGTDTEDRPERERSGGRRGRRGASAVAAVTTAKAIAAATLPETGTSEAGSEASGLAEAPENAAAETSFSPESAVAPESSAVSVSESSSVSSRPAEPSSSAPSSSSASSSASSSSAPSSSAPASSSPSAESVKEAPGRKRPSVAAWATVSTPSEEHEPVTVTVSVPPVPESESAKPARRRTRGGSARASVAAVVTTPAPEPVTAPEPEAPAAAEPVTAAEPAAAEPVVASDVAEPAAAPAEAPEPAASAPEPAEPASEQTEFAFDPAPATAPAPAPEQAPEAEAPAPEAEAAPESEAAPAPGAVEQPETAEAASEPTQPPADEPRADDGFPFWS